MEKMRTRYHFELFVKSLILKRLGKVIAYMSRDWKEDDRPKILRALNISSIFSNVIQWLWTL